MKLRLVAVAFSLPLLAAALAVTSALAGERGSQRMDRLRGVNFVSACTFSHRAPDDDPRGARRDARQRSAV